MKENKKIDYASAEAATQKTVTDWVSNDGRFFGDNEHIARWNGCTHLLCSCGSEMTKTYTLCNTCREKAATERFNAMPFQEWDGETPLCIFDDDTYLFDESEIEMYCEGNNIEANDLQLVICAPQYAWEIDDDYFSDILPEDTTLADCDDELAVAIEQVNNLIRQRAKNKEKPISWISGKFRTSYNPVKGA